MANTYFKDLSQNRIKFCKAAKDQGVIMNYTVLSSDAASEKDWNLMLMIELKNYAAIDGIGDKPDALAEKLPGNDATQHQSAISRNDMREIIGGKLAREFIFK